MNNSYSFKQNEIESIINKFGKTFYEKVLEELEVFQDKWALYNIQLVPSYSANLVFKCESKLYGKTVLKIGNPIYKETFTEFNTLCEYKGRKFVEVFEADIEKGIILEQCIEPGKSLRAEGNLEKRLSIFCELYKGLHIPVKNEEIYPTYINWVCRITDYMEKREDCTKLYLHMKKAKELCLSLSKEYSSKMLLHGDFHHDNIVLSFDEKYIIIDPKGVVGDPIFDIARFILNEFSEKISEGDFDKIKYIINRLSEELSIPSNILSRCLYIETTMGMCWCIESGSKEEEYCDLLEKVTFAEDILKANN